MKKYIYLLTVLFFVSFFGCNELEIAPINVVKDEDVFTEAGMKAYMAALYSRMPIEDFKISTTGGTEGFNDWGYFNTPLNNTGEGKQHYATFFDPARGYWKSGYQVIRNANYLIEQLPSYTTSLSQEKITQWVAEAKFVRAFTYFALVKRYGGVPITTEVQAVDNTTGETLNIPRKGEGEVYDFILDDLDDAITNLSETSEHRGRVNKNIALAFKSRVALFAGSIARYGSPYEVGGVMLCGIPKEKANDYFTQSFQAAKAIEDIYSLYMKQWSATDKTATANNYANLFLDGDSPETIFAKEYKYPDARHSYDALMSPNHLTTTYGGRFCPTLDYIELFDGLPKNEKGQLKTTDESGNYIVYDDIGQLFEECEPRLRGTALLPGQPFKGGYTDIRRGTIIESIDPSTPIRKFFGESSTAPYSSNSWYVENIKEAATWSNQIPIELSSGYKINPSGLFGPVAGHWPNNTGFAGRKWLQPDLAVSETVLGGSDQTWIEIRYAEVLLNRAEAALELYQNGVSNVDGIELQSDAYNCINDIRTRAGAILLSNPSELSSETSVGVNEGVGGYVLAPTRGLQIIRIERRKELAFENKLWWDMRRWRTFDREVDSRIWRMCNPFLFAKGAVPETIDYTHGKYIFDCRFDEIGTQFTFLTKYYYEPIPNSEIVVNENLVQNPQY